MAWALGFELGDYATIDRVYLPGDFDIEFTFLVDSSAGSNVAAIETNEFGGQWLGKFGGSHILYWDGSFELVGGFAIDTEYKYRVVRVGSNVDWYINDVLESSFTKTNQLVLFRISKASAGLSGWFGYLDVIKGGVATHYLDPDSSDRSNTGQQPVIVDTVGTNDATGVGFPTDGSAWIDLGGSGSSGTVAVTMSPLTVSASGNIGEAASGVVNSLFDDFTVNASGSIGDTTTGTVNVTLAVATISASGNVGEPVNGTTSVLLDSLSINGIGNIGEAVTGTISHQLIDFTVDAEGTFALAVTGAVNVQMDDFTIFGRESQGGGIYGVISVIPIEAIEINAEPIEVITK